MSNEEIKIGDSRIEKIRGEAEKKAERWFQEGPLAKVRELEEEGEKEGVVRGYLLSDFYLGDVWNRVAAVRSFFEKPELQEEFLAAEALSKEDFLERERLTFFFMLKTINQVPYLPKEVKVVFDQLAERVYEEKWGRIEDVQKLEGEREKIAGFVEKEWGEDLRAADEHLNKRLF